MADTPACSSWTFQNGVVERLGSDTVLAAADRAAQAARAAGVPVFFVRVAFRPGYPEVAQTNAGFAAVAGAGDAMTHDHAGTQVHAALAPRADEPVVVKRRVSAFSGSDPDVLLRAKQADTLVLTEKVFPRQARVTTTDEWIATLGA